LPHTPDFKGAATRSSPFLSGRGAARLSRKQAYQPADRESGFDAVLMAHDLRPQSQVGCPLNVNIFNIIIRRMDPLPPSASPAPGNLRTRAAYHHLIYALGKSLPPPGPDTPEARYRRDRAAIAQIAALCPANAAKASLATQFVAASEQAMGCLRLTHDPVTPPLLTLKCNAQAALMMRQAQGAMRTLLQVQAARRKINADEAAWTEYTTGRIMTEK
jgi:hypothetical protein